MLRQGVQGISDIIAIPGIINRDFADVKTTMAGMGHAVMGTAIRSGANRAVEAAQAAMASPLLEAGAIDGARGILINITGSSSLKLSEVNEASSLIQTAAHEDANIIFGAVLDEKMGEEVKITVIATGFRDQMPERRARMLSVVEEPVISVPVVAPDSWMREAAPLQAAPPARFMSQDEEEEEAAVERDEAHFFSASTPVVSTRINVMTPAARSSAEPVAPVEPELVAAEPMRPHFNELAEEPAYTPAPRESAPEAAKEPRTTIPGDAGPAQPGPALFPDPNTEPERDLDVPAFMRRLRF